MTFDWLNIAIRTPPIDILIDMSFFIYISDAPTDSYKTELSNRIYKKYVINLDAAWRTLLDYIEQSGYVIQSAVVCVKRVNPQENQPYHK